MNFVLMETMREVNLNNNSGIYEFGIEWEGA